MWQLFGLINVLGFAWVYHKKIKQEVVWLREEKIALGALLVLAFLMGILGTLVFTGLLIYLIIYFCQIHQKIGFMDILLYFAFGALNVGLILLFSNLYRRRTSIDLFPGRSVGNISEMVICSIAYLLSGPFGTAVCILLGLVLFIIWKKYYKKKQEMFGIPNIFFIFVS